MIRNIRWGMMLHRHVRPFLMPPARRRHLAISHTFDQNRHGKTMGNRTVTFSKCTRVTFGQAGSEESPHLRHMRCTDSAGIHRLVRRRKTEEAIFLHCCIGDYRRAVVNAQRSRLEVDPPINVVQIPIISDNGLDTGGPQEQSFSSGSSRT